MDSYAFCGPQFSSGFLQRAHETGRSIYEAHILLSPGVSGSKSKVGLRLGPSIEEPGVMRHHETSLKSHVIVLFVADQNILRHFVKPVDTGVARQNDSTPERVQLAAARNTLESLWRLPKTLWSLFGGRQTNFNSHQRRKGTRRNCRRHSYIGFGDSVESNSLGSNFGFDQTGEKGDKGHEFINRISTEVHRLPAIKQKVTSPITPELMGWLSEVIERFKTW
ncbi:hypothetical protein PoB_007697400 [Plakobranchus ocellatus]|uniref:Uncharacterized protein n=1 Tax=Plakobranchus ocellatus TaxID=259542 RepID=A0AAV4E1X0_9GAST|nr:hypothetical protein PoB_007697400 [Plakobranchus ocellatus]